MSSPNLSPKSDFIQQYVQSKVIASNALKNKENIVLLGDSGRNGKTHLKNELINEKSFSMYTSLYGLQEINNKIPLKEKPFILETNNKADLKKLDSFEVPYVLIDMPLSISN